MKAFHQIGDLVHIPQAVRLLQPPHFPEDPQLSIPSHVSETQKPTIGIITDISQPGYVQIFCDGTRWSVRNTSVYALKGLSSSD